MNATETHPLEGLDGVRGVVALRDGSDTAVVTLDTGERVEIESRLLSIREDGSYFAPLRPQDIGSAARPPPEIIPVVREELDVTARRRESGSVTVEITPHSHSRSVDLPLTDERIEVERVPIDRFVDAPASPREEGDVTIVPVYEEVLTVERKLKLKEEIRLTKTRSSRVEHRDIEMRTEEARIIRRDEEKNGEPARPAGR